MSSSKSGKNLTNKELLEMYVKGWKIFMDTCSLLDPYVDRFWEMIVPVLEMYSKAILIPLVCIKEVEKKAKGHDDLAMRAVRCIHTLKVLRKKKLIDIRADATDQFADNVFQVVFTQHRMNQKLLLITQDHGLAQDILNLNENKSVRGKNVNVKRINTKGELGNFYFGTGDSAKKSYGNKPDAFKVCKHVTTMADVPNKLTHQPVAHENVYTDNGPVMLIKQLASGGEGIIYETNTPYVAKIYKPDHNTTRKSEKIKLMQSKPVKCEGICYPMATLYNAQHEFVGYLMPKANGVELAKSVFIKPLLQKKFPNWKKIDTVQLCLTILKKIKYLHDRNIIMGDINPNNILVVDPKKVYFVDTDSYQIEDFPCPVGTTLFTAPEIQGKTYSQFLRTVGNENFAIATLLFMIMLPGKPPYAQQGGDNLAANIINGDFPYALGEKTNGKAPEGVWRYIWSHLTYKVKSSFYKTFKKGEAYASEKSRLSVDDWIRLFEEYHTLLEKNTLQKNDPMSGDLFPTRLKFYIKEDTKMVECKLCHKKYPEYLTTNGYCKPCLNKYETYTCECCGEKLVYKNYDRYIKRIQPRRKCEACQKKGKEAYTTRVCPICGKRFVITNNDYEFYKNKGWDLPIYCKACRDMRRNGYRQTTKPVPTPRPTTYSTRKPNYQTKERSGLFKVFKKIFGM